MSDARATVEVITGEAELGELASEWDRLFVRTPMASGFESHLWIAECWRQRHSASSRLYVCVVRIDGVVVALIPTQLDRGTLRFIGREDSNYSGPVFVPEYLEEVVAAWSEHLAGSPAVRAVDLGGLRGGLPFTTLVGDGLPHWGPPITVRSNVCPEVDLTPGWDAVYGRHKGKTKSIWRRQETRMGAIGDVAIDLLTEPGDVTRELPGLFGLWESHFRGRRISGAFAPDRQGFQAFMAARAASAGLVELWVMRLDGEVIAFSYGIRGRDATTSYIVAYEDALAIFSPGKLLLLRVLERAATNHDPLYDFSLGQAPYKEQWATGSRPVYRMLWGKLAAWRVARDRAWVRARDIRWLHRLKVEGLAALRTVEPIDRASDKPGLPAGSRPETSVWENRRHATPVTLRGMKFAEMRAVLSPRLLRRAAEAVFRGDSVYAMEWGGQVAGVVFRAAEPRREMIAGRWEAQSEGSEVYYRLVALHEEERATLAAALPGPGLLVSASPVPGARFLGELTGVAT